MDRTHDRGLPPFGKELFVAVLPVAFVDEQGHATVRLGSNESADGLEYAIESRIGVGEVETEFRIFTVSEFAEALFDEIVLGIHLRKTDADNSDAYEAFSNEINAFAKDASEHSEAQQ
jgi:hypothetical protein